jgi:protein gp37
MGETTGISWADGTFNIAIGCEKISEACAHCYAERDMENPKYGRRFKGAWGPEKFRYMLSDGYWKKPLSWQRKLEKEGRRMRVFASSLCDIFENHALIDAQRARLFELIQKTPNIDWLLLTKRIERAASLWPWPSLEEVPKNIWIGTTVENQRRAVERIPWLLRIAAWRHFISCEPLLGSIGLISGIGGTQWLGGQRGCAGMHHGIGTPECPAELHHHHDALCGPGIDWIIAGGESGPDAMPTNPNWVRFLETQARLNGVPFHFKQWGEWRPALPGEEISTHNGKARKPPLFIDCNGHVHCCQEAAGPNAVPMVMVGKKKAGRLLEGQLYDAIPDSAAA